MNHLTPNNALTFESLMASIHESNRFLTEKFAETDRLQKENERQFKENWEKYERRMKKMEETMGSWSHNHGSFAEEYFFNSFENAEQNFFGEEFDEIRKYVHIYTPKLEDEYDIVLYNHTSVAIIEVKFKAHENDVKQTLKKAETFRVLCPDYKDFKIYLGLASMSFHPELEQLCTEQGIAIIKQVGDSVVINDAHLKVF
ncbi:MAG: hypothetical protein FWC10_08415 [Lentimicrobiaceae bacterium]|nr:hypothetical protein [Lentimicrobiaceae bacterium]